MPSPCSAPGPAGARGPVLLPVSAFPPCPPTPHKRTPWQVKQGLGVEEGAGKAPEVPSEPKAAEA